jgi:hypothetical protein
MITDEEALQALLAIETAMLHDANLEEQWLLTLLRYVRQTLTEKRGTNVA